MCKTREHTIILGWNWMFFYCWPPVFWWWNSMLVAEIVILVGWNEMVAPIFQWFLSTEANPKLCPWKETWVYLNMKYRSPKTASWWKNLMHVSAARESLLFMDPRWFVPGILPFFTERFPHLLTSCDLMGWYFNPHCKILWKFGWTLGSEKKKKTQKWLIDIKWLLSILLLRICGMNGWFRFVDSPYPAPRKELCLDA